MVVVAAGEDPNTEAMSVPVSRVSTPGAPATGKFSLMKRESHSIRARRWCVWAAVEAAGVEKEHLCPALAHRVQMGKVRLHFFLKLRQRSQAGMSRAAFGDDAEMDDGAAPDAATTADADAAPEVEMLAAAATAVGL